MNVGYIYRFGSWQGISSEGVFSEIPSWELEEELSVEALRLGIETYGHVPTLDKVPAEWKEDLQELLDVAVAYSETYTLSDVNGLIRSIMRVTDVEIPEGFKPYWSANSYIPPLGFDYKKGYAAKSENTGWYDCATHQPIEEPSYPLTLVWFAYEPHGELSEIQRVSLNLGDETKTINIVNQPF